MVGMTVTTTVEKALRRDRALVVGGLLFVVLLSWAYLMLGAGVMFAVNDSSMAMQMQPWTLGYAFLMLVMWVVMMAAMMLPGAAPMLLLFAKMAHAREAKGQRAATVGVFGLGYLVIWTAFSLVAVALQFGLESAALLSPMMETTSMTLAGTVLVAAGIYQWTSLKHACLRHCRSPLDFMLSQWREGSRGAFVMGCRHGMYCVGCCWMLMLLLFVGGVMNLAWIAALAIFVLVEKLAPAGQWLSRGTGAVLFVWGVATLAMAIQAPIA